MTLAAIILTYNEADRISDCIESVQFADVVIVFDSYSKDRTVELARQHGAEIIQHPFENYASQRNAALDVVRGRAEWVLFVDADERVTSELAHEVREAIKQQPEVAGWRIPRHNFIFGRLTHGAGWYPDYQTRLLKVDTAHYDPQRQVHELVLLDGVEGTLTQPLIHYNYADADQFHRKQRAYSDYDARMLYEQGIRPKPQNYILQPLRQFWWRFVTLKGYQDNWHGLRLSVLMARYEFRKYVVLRQLVRGDSVPPR